MRRLLALLIASVLPLAAHAAPAERRVALVIGNGAYVNFAPLANPRNDAEDVSVALNAAGFEVFGGADLSREALRERLRAFARSAEGAEAALVFYAGHGLQYKGRNYVVPIDAKLVDEFDLEYEAVRVDDLVGELNRAEGARILILDACRNLPLKERSARNPFYDTGLAKLSGRNLVVAYATQANAVAYDGAGRNSVFTTALLKTLAEPGLDIPQFFQAVSIAVDRESGGKQTPELSFSYPGRFYLNRAETDQDEWRRIRTSDDLSALRDFLERHPRSDLADAAKARLARLAGERAPVAALLAAAPPRDVPALAPPSLPAARVPSAPAVAPQPVVLPPAAVVAALAVSPPAVVASLPPPPLARTEPARPEPEGDVRNSSALVLEAQTELRRIACYLGPLDGVLNASTRMAMTAYARQNNLAWSGDVGPNAVAWLRQSRSGSCAAAPPATPPAITAASDPGACRELSERAQVGAISAVEAGKLRSVCR